MVELGMVHVSFFGGFLSVGSRVSFEQYILFMLYSAKKSRQDGRKSMQARPGPHLNAAAKAGKAGLMKSQAGLAP